MHLEAFSTAVHVVPPKWGPMPIWSLFLWDSHHANSCGRRSSMHVLISSPVAPVGTLRKGFVRDLPCATTRVQLPAMGHPLGRSN